MLSSSQSEGQPSEVYQVMQARMCELVHSAGQERSRAGQPLAPACFQRLTDGAPRDRIDLFLIRLERAALVAQARNPRPCRDARLAFWRVSRPRLAARTSHRLAD
jgi:hypothetical protein